MSNKETGGTAFPVFPETGMGHAAAFQGMTLRDYFAAKAMEAATSGHISHYGHDSNHWLVKDIASYAYELADAMMEARK